MSDYGIRRRREGIYPEYAYNLLPYPINKVYTELLRAINAFKTEVLLSYEDLYYEDVCKVIRYIQIDHPEICWLDTYLAYSNPTTKIVSKVTLEYCMTQSDARRRNRKINKAIKPILKSVSPTMSDYQAVKTVYENIIRLTDYDSVGLAKSMRKSKKSKVDDLRSIYGVFVNKKAVCAGYARATQYLLNRIGIECVYVVGEVRHEPHAWNLIKLEDDYYYMDTTWGDHSNTKRESNYDNNIHYDYFCITTEELLLTHTILEDGLPLPECEATHCNYYVREGLFFEEYSFDKVKEVIKARLDRGERTVSLKFATEDVYDEAFRSLVEEHGVFSIISLIGADKKKITSSYKYSSKKERRILNLYFEND